MVMQSLTLPHETRIPLQEAISTRKIFLAETKLLSGSKGYSVLYKIKH